MTGMPRPRPPFLNREVTRHGKVIWTVRIGKGPRTRIRAEYGTPEFDAAYTAAVTGNPVPRGKATNGTLEWLVDRYRETSAWRDELAAATRRQRDNIFRNIIAEHGRDPYRAVTAASLVKSRDRRAGTPAQARNFLDAMRGLFRWALAAGLVRDDPTAGVKNPKRKKGPGFKKWTEEQVDQYYARWPLGTRQRVWIDVLLYTGLRRGDAVRFGKQHVRNGVGLLPTEKSRGRIAAVIPVLPVLQRTLDAGPVGDLAFICGERGRPLTKESFGNLFKDACRQAGIDEPKKAAHGLRKIGATRAAENGATPAQLDALFAWEMGSGTSAVYIREANRKLLALQATGALLRNEEGTSAPAPEYPVRAVGEKTK